MAADPAHPFARPRLRAFESEACGHPRQAFFRGEALQITQPSTSDPHMASFGAMNSSSTYTEGARSTGIPARAAQS